jgi:hypothetical protein
MDDRHPKYFVKDPIEHSTDMSETHHYSRKPEVVRGIGAVEVRVHRLAEALDGLIQRVATAQAPGPAPGPYSATTRMHLLAIALDRLIHRVVSSRITFVPAPGSPRFRFFYAEKQTLATLKYNELPDPDDNTFEKIEFCVGRFYFEGTNNYIDKISIVGEAAAELEVRIVVAGLLDDPVKIRIGFMHISTYKKLFRFVVAQGYADLLGDPIGDHIRSARLTQVS